MMVINNNLPALNAYDVVNNTSNQLQKSIQKLSTGLRINSAADDAAGLSISEKMRAQINGLDQAVRNTQDGISLIQTAEGALTETHSILQRMRELSVQAANDTYTAQDRSYIQEEVDLLREEIDHIGNTTTFNTKKLLNGDSGAVWSSDNLNTSALIRGGLRTIDQFGQKSSAEGNYKITVKSEAGLGEVQKSSILRIKHAVNDWQATANTEIGIAASSEQKSPTGEVPNGKYTISGTVYTDTETGTDATVRDVAAKSENDVSLTAAMATHALTNGSTDTATDVLNSNYNLKLTVSDVDTTNGVVTFAVSGSKIDKDGTVTDLGSVDEVFDTFTLGTQEDKTLHLEGYNGLKFTNLSSLDNVKNFTVGDEFAFNVAATAKGGDSVVKVSEESGNIKDHQFTFTTSDIANKTSEFTLFSKDDPSKTGTFSLTTTDTFVDDARTGEWLVYTKGVDAPTSLTYTDVNLGWNAVNPISTGAAGATRDGDGWNESVLSTTGTSISGITTNKGGTITVKIGEATAVSTGHTGSLSNIRKESKTTDSSGNTTTSSSSLSTSADFSGFTYTAGGFNGVVSIELGDASYVAAATSTAKFNVRATGVMADGTAVNNASASINVTTNGSAVDVTVGGNTIGTITMANATSAADYLASLGAKGDTYTFTQDATIANGTDYHTIEISDGGAGIISEAAPTKYYLNNDAISATTGPTVNLYVPLSASETAGQGLEDNTAWATGATLTKDFGTVTLKFADNVADAGIAYGTTIGTFKVGKTSDGDSVTNSNVSTAAMSDSSSIGEVASGSNRLYDIEQFWDAQGNFMLTDPQSITITQGDGQTATVTLYQNDTIDNVVSKLNTAIAEDLGQKAYVDDATQFVSYVEEPTSNSTSESVKGTMLVRSAVTGSNGTLNFASKNEDLINALGLNTIQKATENVYKVTVQDAHTGEVVNEIKDEKITGNVLVGRLHKNVDVEFDDMTGIKATWNDNQKKYVMSGDESGEVTYLHLSDNTVVFQIGANEGDDMGINIGDMRSHALGLDGVLVTNREAASRSITLIDNAIDKVSTQRAKLGAYQNRLEHTSANLTTSAENLTAAESRIRDTDMAKQMMEFTKLQIMLQAGNSMLAQANQLPQNVLSLIR